MKNLIIAIILLGLTSCGQKAIEDKRPAEQANFVNYIRQLRDKVNATGEDKTLRGTILDQSVSDVKAYIKDTLNLKFNQWQVKVQQIKQNSQNPASTDVTLGIAIDQDNQSAEKALILSSTVPDGELSKSMKVFKTGDQLIISGDFIEKKGFIDIDSYSRYKFSKNVFDNPEFKINIKIAEKL